MGWHHLFNLLNLKLSFTPFYFQGHGRVSTDTLLGFSEMYLSVMWVVLCMFTLCSRQTFTAWRQTLLLNLTFNICSFLSKARKWRLETSAVHQKSTPHTRSPLWSEHVTVMNHFRAASLGSPPASRQAGNQVCCPFAIYSTHIQVLQGGEPANEAPQRKSCATQLHN